MRKGLFTFLAVCALAGTGAAKAAAMPDFSTPAPIQHVQDQRFADLPRQPYAMNYTDEAAQSLGMQDGKWEAFDTRSNDPLMPSLKGGIDSGGAMIRLQWRSGD